MISSCCSNGSIVTVTETATNTVFVVDGVPTLIPKYKDCNGADLDAGAELATCQHVTDSIAAIPAVPYATSTVPGIVTLALASEYPSTSTTEAATPAFVNAAIAAIPDVPVATDTVVGISSLAVAANYPSTSDAESATPAYVTAAVNALVPLATDTVVGKVSLAVASEYPSNSNTEATTPAYVNAAIAAIPVIPAATSTILGTVTLAVASEYPSTSNVEAATPAYVSAAVAAAVGAIAGDDDVTSTALEIVGTNLRVTVTEGTTVVTGNLPLIDLIDAIVGSTILRSTLASGLLSADGGNSLRIGTDGLLFENDAI